MFLGGALSDWIFAFVCYGDPRAKPFKLYELMTCEALLEPGPAECAKRSNRISFPSADLDANAERTPATASSFLFHTLLTNKKPLAQGVGEKLWPSTRPLKLLKLTADAPTDTPGLNRSARTRGADIRALFN